MTDRANLGMPLRVLRLRSGSRYVVALVMADGHLGRTPFWSAEQAFLGAGINSRKWNLIETEVYNLDDSADVPGGYLLFVRKARGGDVRGVVVWGTGGLMPLIYSSVDVARRHIWESFQSNALVL